MRGLFILFSIFLISGVKGQNQSYTKDTFSRVIVLKDPRFDEMAMKQAELNRKALQTGPRLRSGFRIQAANTRNRDEANAVKAELLRRYPDQKTYLLYQAPNFRVRIGNFLTQREAFQLRKMISALYPAKGIYIVPDTIEYTPPDEDDDLD